jgi:hypothetical protein
MDAMDTALKKISEIKDATVNATVTVCDFAVISSQVEYMKHKKQALTNNYLRQIDKNDTYNKLSDDKEHLRKLIGTINKEIFYYREKINGLSLNETDNDTLTYDYDKIIESLSACSYTLRDINNKLVKLTDVTDDQLELKKIKYDKDMTEIELQIAEMNSKKITAKDQLHKYTGAFKSSYDSPNVDLTDELYVPTNSNDLDNLDTKTHSQKSPKFVISEDTHIDNIEKVTIMDKSDENDENNGIF